MIKEHSITVHCGVSKIKIYNNRHFAFHAILLKLWNNVMWAQIMFEPVVYAYIWRRTWLSPSPNYRVAYKPINWPLRVRKCAGSVACYISTNVGRFSILLHCETRRYISNKIIVSDLIIYTLNASLQRSVKYFATSESQRPTAGGFFAPRFICYMYLIQSESRQQDEIYHIPIKPVCMYVRLVIKKKTASDVI